MKLNRMQTARLSASSEQGRPRFLRLIDELFLVLMRLRLGLLLEDLTDRFLISTSLCYFQQIDRLLRHTLILLDISGW